MKKSFEYIIKISETEFYDKLKNILLLIAVLLHMIMDMNFILAINNITDLKVTSTSLLSRRAY